MFKFGIISFRAVPRIIEVVAYFFKLPIRNYHFTSIINWFLKLGLYKLKSQNKIIESWTAIIDESIKLGKKKLLLILKVPSKIMNKQKKALNFNDIEIVGLYIKDTFTGEIISNLLKELFSKIGNPKQILTDGGSNLAKASKLILNTKEDKFFHTLDIGHFSANILKRAYINNGDFKKFLEFTSRVSLKLNQTVAAWISPNKISLKARFQGISELAKWSRKAFKYCKNHINDCDKETKDLLIKNFQGHEFLVKLAENFYTDCQVINDVSKLVKNEGLSENTYFQSINLLSSLPIKSEIRISLENYLKFNLEIFNKNQLDAGLLSSDIIESVFGKIKYFMKNTSLKEFNRLSLILPSLVGEFNEQIIINAIKEIKIHDIKKWEEENVKDTILKKKRKEFSKINISKNLTKDAEYNDSFAA